MGAFIWQKEVTFPERSDFLLDCKSVSEYSRYEL